MIRGFGCNADDIRGVWRAFAEKSTDSLSDSAIRLNFTWRSGNGNEDCPMVSFKMALELLLQNTRQVGSERCRIEDANTRVLRENIVADRPFPAFDRVMMDGFALRLADWKYGCRNYRIGGTSPAGKPVLSLAESAGNCLEVMTGAPCPIGADVIIPVEEIVSRNANEVIFSESAAPVAGRFIHQSGSDAALGEVLLPIGRLLGAREVGIAASCGYAHLEVSCLPRITVIATGDELVPVDQFPEPYQIRQSNAHSLAVALTKAGYAPQSVLHMKDDVETARSALQVLLKTSDWIILTGAVSKGAHDFVPTLLTELGCQKIFHGIAQRPGKPAGLWMGLAGQIILALPGNPVSALTGLHALAIPALAASSGRLISTKRRVVMDDTSGQLSDLTRHLPVTLREDGRAEAAAVGNSGDFIGLIKSDGFITLPPRGEIAAAYTFTPWL